MRGNLIIITVFTVSTETSIKLGILIVVEVN